MGLGAIMKPARLSREKFLAAEALNKKIAQFVLMQANRIRVLKLTEELIAVGSVG
jgi:hypothetical protein